MKFKLVEAIQTQMTYVVYHGSQQQHLQLEDKPLYATESKDVAIQFAKGYNFNYDLQPTDHPTLYKLEMKLTNPKIINNEDEWFEMGDITVVDRTADLFESQGYDGIIDSTPADKFNMNISAGTTHYIVYAESDTPDGPFTYKGRILEPVLGWTTHHSIVEYNGKWYLFYHDCELSNGINHRRNVKFTELTIHEDGTIDTIIP